MKKINKVQETFIFNTRQNIIHSLFVFLISLFLLVLINSYYDDNILGIQFQREPIHQEYSWFHQEKLWTLSFEIDPEEYLRYRDERKWGFTVENVTYNDPLIKEIAEKFLDITNGYRYCKPCFVASFVQSIPYVPEMLDYHKYPVETLAEKGGDCEDTSYLAAALMKAMGIDVVLLEMPTHLAVGVYIEEAWSGICYKLNDKCYYYLETTAEWNIGDIPEDVSFLSIEIVEIP